MTANQIKTMTADECHKAMNKIEGMARMNGKELTAAQKKQIKALEKRATDIADQYCED